MSESVRPEPSRFYRWMVLIFVSIAMFGNYYVYDALSPLADVLKQQLGFYGFEHRPAAGDLQFSQHFHRGHWRGPD